jgi:peptidoglycan hydrolase-like protein with peptidoglycan-binding domain
MTHARCSTRNHQSHWPTTSIGRSIGDPILARLHGLASRIGYWLSGALILGLFLTLAVPAAAARTATSPTQQSRASGQLALSAAIPAASLPTWPVLRPGSNPPVTVRSLQYLLNAHGAGLVVDGIFGPRTGTAVREFQRAHGLVVDGIVGPRTWSAVIVTVRRGSVGPAVKAVQDQANSRIGASGTTSHGLVVDGIFGARTDDWVNDFQSAIAGHVLDYPVDGIVGPLTWSLLITGENPQPLHSE